MRFYSYARGSRNDTWNWIRTLDETSKNTVFLFTGFTMTHSFTIVMTRISNRRTCCEVCLSVCCRCRHSTLFGSTAAECRRSTRSICPRSLGDVSLVRTETFDWENLRRHHHHHESPGRMRERETHTHCASQVEAASLKGIWYATYSSFALIFQAVVMAKKMNWLTQCVRQGSSSGCFNAI